VSMPNTNLPNGLGTLSILSNQNTLRESWRKQPMHIKAYSKHGTTCSSWGIFVRIKSRMEKKFRFNFILGRSTSKKNTWESGFSLLTLPFCLGCVLLSKLVNNACSGSEEAPPCAIKSQDCLILLIEINITITLLGKTIHHLLLLC
jgi:hypothetical protein